MNSRNNERNEIRNDRNYKATDADKANQVAPSSPSESTSRHPQADAAASSADNDMDRQTSTQHNLQQDAEEAQSDGNLSFPEGK